MYNESDNVGVFYQRTSAVLEALGLTWEIVCVDDGSRDDTLDQLIALHRRDGRVKVVELARNFGKEIALTAGLDAAAGRAVVPIDADLQDPPELIPAMVERWRQGYDVVFATRTERRTLTGAANQGSSQLRSMRSRQRASLKPGPLVSRTLTVRSWG